MRTNRFRIAATAVLLAALPAHAAEDADLARLVRNVMDTGLVPGMSVAVVRDGHVVLENGIGYADLEGKREVTRATRFYTASTSKALLALTAVRLDARGALDLDEPLSTALPGAKWHADLHPDSITVKDLVTLTHGIGDGPVSFRIAFTGQSAPDELLAALAEHGPGEPGRTFQYDNLGYDLLGFVISAKTGKPWRDALDAEVLRPLGMTHATMRPSTLRPDEAAVPYELAPDGFERCLGVKTDANMGAAGAIWATAGDLARVLLFELQRGELDGRRIAASALVEETQKLHVPYPPKGEVFVKNGWGLGWDIGEYGGTKLLGRDGDFAGWHSHVSLLPERGMGVVVLVNGGRAAAMAGEFLAAMIYDHMLGRTADRPFLEELAQMKSQALGALAADRGRRAARPQVMPLPFEGYTGVYANPAWGTVELVLDGGKLEARLGVLRCGVEVFDGAKGLLRVDLAGRGTVVATMVPEGGKTASELKFPDCTYSRAGEGRPGQSNR